MQANGKIWLNRLYLSMKNKIPLIIALIFGLLIALNLKVVAQSESNLTVSAAASLQESLQQIRSLQHTIKPQTTIIYNFGSSGSLQQQIEQGAPVDVFIAAAPKQMDALEAKNLLEPNTRQNLLTNQLALITPKNITNITSFADLTKPEIKKIALGEPQSVPAGKYGEETLNFFKIASQVKDKLVYAKDVRQVLTYVESGNVDAGIVYVTDAKTSDKVNLVAIAPREAHTPIVYPLAIIKGSKNLQAAKDFVDFLTGEVAKGIFEKYGFSLIK